MFLLRGAEMGFNRRFVSRVGSDEAIGPGGKISNWETSDVFFITSFAETGKLLIQSFSSTIQ